MSGEVFRRKVQKNRTIQIPLHFVEEYFSDENGAFKKVTVEGDYNLKNKELTIFNSKTNNCYYLGLKKYCGISAGDIVEISIVNDNKLYIEVKNELKKQS